MTEEERASCNVPIKEAKEKKQVENGRGETKILLESFRPKSEKVVYTRERVRKDSLKEKEKEWLVLYTNINRLVSTLSDINDYLRTKKPDIFSLIETKLNDSEDVPVGEE